MSLYTSKLPILCFVIIFLITSTFTNVSEGLEKAQWEKDWNTMNRAIDIARKKTSENIERFLFAPVDFRGERSIREQNIHTRAVASLFQFQAKLNDPNALGEIEQWVIFHLKESYLPKISLAFLNNKGLSVPKNLTLDEVQHTDYVTHIRFTHAFDGLINIFLKEDITLQAIYPVYLTRFVIRKNLYACLKRELLSPINPEYGAWNKRALRAQQSMNMVEVWMRNPRKIPRIRQHLINYIKDEISPPFRLRVLNDRARLHYLTKRNRVTVVSDSSRHKLLSDKRVLKILNDNEWGRFSVLNDWERCSARHISIQELFFNPSSDFIKTIRFTKAFLGLEDMFQQENINLKLWLGITDDPLTPNKSKHN